MSEQLDGRGAQREPLERDADVLVLGGGPAGCWAAWSAARAGAKVVLAEKGYVGSSGATASTGTGFWHLPPDEKLREAAVAEREALGGNLTERRWMHRVLDQVYENLPLLDKWGYPFPIGPDGNVSRGTVQGPDYMKAMRRAVREAGVTILDQSPALELLADAHGVGGAVGISRLDNRYWKVRAGSVVLAAGGCAFLSKALGCNTNTGDAGLMAAELGVELSGMEFSSHYSFAYGPTSVTKGGFFFFATFTREDGSVIGGVDPRHSYPDIAEEMLKGPVYACLDQAKPEWRENMRGVMPNFFTPFKRVGIDPFVDRFPVTLRCEGTVRGTGGIRIVSDDCGTTVPGLYAAGDSATRELVTGAFSGGGSHNAAWATSSGTWAGKAAAEHALSLGAATHSRKLQGAGRNGIRPSGPARGSIDYASVVLGVQNEVLPYDKNIFRTQERLSASLARLDALWNTLGGEPPDDLRGILRTREAAAMVATARWMYESALARRESRGMHRRLDYPNADPAQTHRLITGGLDCVRVRPEHNGRSIPAGVREAVTA